MSKTFPESNSTSRYNASRRQYPFLSVAAIGQFENVMRREDIDIQEQTASRVSVTCDSHVCLLNDLGDAESGSRASISHSLTRKPTSFDPICLVLQLVRCDPSPPRCMNWKHAPYY
jgi:hypothetical protein